MAPRCRRCRGPALYRVKDNDSNNGAAPQFFCGEACQREEWISVKSGLNLAAPDAGGLEKEEMGRGWWVALHSLVGHLGDSDDAPLTEAERQDVRALVGILRRRYPCGICRKHFNTLMDAHPLDAVALATPRSLQRWLSDRHNDVNAATGKPAIPFDTKNKPRSCVRH